MTSPAQAFKTAQEAALRASAALQTAMGSIRLYTEVPTNAPLPYVVLGQDEVILENHDCAPEAELTSTVNWWSRTSTPDKGAQAREMGAAIIDALNAQLSLTGWTVDEWEQLSERYVTDPDGSTHGIGLFRYLLTQVA